MDELGASAGEHQLWVNLSSLGEGNVFAYLNKIMERLIAENPSYQSEDKLEVTLPSDYEWRTKIYLKLLAKRRLMMMEEAENPR